MKGKNLIIERMRFQKLFLNLDGLPGPLLRKRGIPIFGNAMT